ncbi:MAG: 16S rRNA (guanine(966)-N(2))-methyltransferase RsmD [Actinomycetes bacterium]
MTRIVSGSARGRRLAVPPGSTTRPTSDRAREALFSTVESLMVSLAGARVLDLYAGSGAVGLEALSRGADHALLVESDARAARTIRDNVAATAVAGAVVRSDRVERLVAGTAPDAPYDFVFLDPPYDLSDDGLRAVLDDLVRGRWMRPGALVVVERATRGGEWQWPGGIEADRSRRYGEATLWYGRAAPAGVDNEG